MIRWACLAASLLSLPMASGCTRVGPSSDRNHGEVRALLVGDPIGLNPLVTDDPQAQFVATLIHGYLFRADSRGRLVPDLAVRIPTRANGDLSADGRTIHYRLRRNARWSDGAPFDARDVVFSFAAAVDPRVNVPDRSGFDDVATVRAEGRYDVTVRLRQPYSQAVETFFAQTANDPYPVLPQHVLARVRDLNRAAFNAKPVGMGPYRLVAWRRNDRIELAAVPGYFQGAPHVPRVIFRIVPDSNTAAALWATGQLDLATFRSTALLQRFRAFERTHVSVQPAVGFDDLEFQVERPYVRDRRVRAAIVAAVDRAALARPFAPFSEARESDRTPGGFAFDPAIHEPAFDPRRAAALLDAAGWHLAGKFRRKNGATLRLVLVCYNVPRYRDPALLVQQELAAVGIEVAIKAFVPAVLLAPADQGGILQGGSFDLAMFGWQPNGLHDDSYLFRCDTRPPAGENSSRICDPRIDQLARVELTTTNPQREAAADRGILRRLIAQSDILFLSGSTYALAVRDGLAGVRASVLSDPYEGAWQWRWTR